MAEEIIAKVGIDTGDAEKDLEKVKEGVEDIGKETEKTAKKTPKLSKGIKAIGTSFKSIASATGIVLVISKAFEFLLEALQRNQKLADAIAIVFDTVSIVFNEVANVLVDVYENISQSTENFDALGKVMGGILTLIITPFKAGFFGISLAIYEAQLAWEKSAFGSGDVERIAELTIKVHETKDALVEVGEAALEAGGDIVKNFSEAVTEATAITEEVVKGVKDISVTSALEQAKTARALENNALLAKTSLQGLIEENDRLAELERQNRDDVNATFEDRIAANEKLKEILDTQKKDMLELADQQIAAAQAELDQLDNIENQVALQEALNEKKAIEAQIEGFYSEQKNNQIALENELRDVKNQIALESKTNLDREILEVEQQYDELFRLAIQAGLDTEELEIQKQEKLKEIRDNAREEEANADEEARNANFEKGVAAAQQLAGQLTAITEQRESMALDAVEQRFAAQFKAAEGDAAKTEALEKQKEAEVLKIKRQFADAKKRGAISEALINTFTAASKSLADFGFPVGAVFAALAVAQGMLQVQQIKAQPAFAQGGIVGGGGTGTSDSITASLSKGESVINAKSTRMFKPLLSTINEAGGGRAFAGNEGSGGSTVGVVKAFVVADDMTNEQDKLTKIRRKATI
jgi:hypothetical protein